MPAMGRSAADRPRGDPAPVIRWPISGSEATARPWGWACHPSTLPTAAAIPPGREDPPLHLDGGQPGHRIGHGTYLSGGTQRIHQRLPVPGVVGMGPHPPVRRSPETRERGEAGSARTPTAGGRRVRSGRHRPHGRCPPPPSRRCLPAAATRRPRRGERTDTGDRNLFHREGGRKVPGRRGHLQYRRQGRIRFRIVQGHRRPGLVDQVALATGHHRTRPDRRWFRWATVVRCTLPSVRPSLVERDGPSCDGARWAVSTVPASAACRIGPRSPDAVTE